MLLYCHSMQKLTRSACTINNSHTVVACVGVVGVVVSYCLADRTSSSCPCSYCALLVRHHADTSWCTNNNWFIEKERRRVFYYYFLQSTLNSTALSREKLARVINTFNGQSARLSRGNMCEEKIAYVTRKTNKRHQKQR